MESTVLEIKPCPICDELDQSMVVLVDQAGTQFDNSQAFTCINCGLRAMGTDMADGIWMAAIFWNTLVNALEQN